jgi:hypothetical protein
MKGGEIEMSEITQDNLNQIQEQLANIEQKIGSKWTLPIVVAIISGLIGMATVAIQVRLEANRDEAAKVREKESAAEEAERIERKQYHDQMETLAVEVRRHFRGQCSRTEPTEDQLNAALEKFQDLADIKRPMYGDDLSNTVQAYGEWVAESLFDPNRANCRTDNDVKFRAVTSALQEFYEHRCKIQRPAKSEGLLSRIL